MLVIKNTKDKAVTATFNSNSIATKALNMLNAYCLISGNPATWYYEEENSDTHILEFLRGTLGLPTKYIYSSTIVEKVEDHYEATVEFVKEEPRQIYSKGIRLIHTKIPVKALGEKDRTTMVRDIAMAAMSALSLKGLTVIRCKALKDGELHV